MTIENQIVEYLKVHQEASVNELQGQIGASRQMLHRILSRMLQEGYLQKLGRAPTVFYRLNRLSATGKEDELVVLKEDELAFLKEHFLQVSERGEKLEGAEAMKAWCRRQKLPLEKTVHEFINTRKKYLNYFLANGLIDGTDKLLGTKGFDAIAVDRMFYCDFYAIERFGKTRLGTLLHYAKQGQNMHLMQEIITGTKERVNALIEKESIDAVGYIPPTIKRHLQLMTVLQKGFNLSLPHLNLVKVTGTIPVPQKALNKIEDRIDNARASIIVKETRQIKNILLIDDAVGSGATINETAAKLKQKGIAQKVIGLSIVGSFKGFDVIQDV